MVDQNHNNKENEGRKTKLNQILSTHFVETEYESVNIETTEADLPDEIEITVPEVQKPSSTETLFKKTVSNEIRSPSEKLFSTIPVGEKKEKIEHLSVRPANIDTKETDLHKKIENNTSEFQNPPLNRKEKPSGKIIPNRITSLSNQSISNADFEKKHEPESAESKDVSSIEPKSKNEKIAVVHTERHIEHESKHLGMESLESPKRLTEAIWYLKRNKIFDGEQCDLITKFNEATEEDILRVHKNSYVHFIRNYSKNGGGFLGDSTYITPRSYDVARLTAGGAIKAAELVLSREYPHSFAFIRPPGHHASADKYGGFCLFNNAAILARYLQQVKHLNKIMIIDWDAHAGNGTMDIFYNDSSVMTLSIHRDPHSFYPRTGFTSQIGSDEGKGFNINVEMPVGSGDDEYKLVFDRIVLPQIKKFSPDFVICCCGFDGYYHEKNVGLKLTSNGYYQMIRDLKSVVHNNLTILMEGGYHRFIGQLCHCVINSLLDKPNPIEEKMLVSEYDRNIQKKTYKEVEEKISKVTELFSLSD